MSVSNRAVAAAELHGCRGDVQLVPRVRRHHGQFPEHRQHHQLVRRQPGTLPGGRQAW